MFCEGVFFAGFDGLMSGWWAGGWCEEDKEGDRVEGVRGSIGVIQGSDK